MPHASVMEILALADLERRLGDDMWRDHFEIASLLGKGDVSLLVFEGNWALAEQNFSLALKVFENASRSFPEELRPVFGLGMAHFGLGNLAEAKVHFLETKALDPLMPDPLFQLGRVAEAQEDWFKAVSYFGSCAKIDSSYQDVLHRLGSALLRTENYDRAARVFGRLVDKGNAPSSVFLNLGILALMRNQESVAREYFQEAVKAGESSGDVQSVKAALSKLDSLDSK